ncbi:MAG: DUF115 domain-containing protein [Spirochaetales bacterium]|nr:DUF115 domain-containing protein [Spirochaetales bacterium]
MTLEPDTLYLLPSPLLGYGMEELLERLPERSFLLGVERYQELMALTQPHLPAQLISGKRCALIRTEYAEATAEFVARLGLHRFKRCRRIDLNGGARLAPDFYTALEEKLNRVIFTYWQTRASLVKMGPLWFRNIFRNIPSLSRGTNLSSLRVQGTILLCGAGESLEESLPLIKKYRDRLFLCAVDTAYPVLTGQGIIPDAVFNLDGQFYNYYDYYHHKDQPLYLISDITAFPASLRLPGVEPILFSSHFAPNDLLKRMEEQGLLPFSAEPMGSVGVTALHLCSLISEGPILMTGLDFSYRPGKSHARDTVYHQLYLSRTKKTLPDGGMTALSLRRPGRIARGQLTGKKLRSDTILEGYYRTFLELTKHNTHRCRQFALDYPSLGVPLMEEKEFREILEKEGTPLVTLNREEGIKSDRIWQEFLTDEISRLEQVLKAWDHYSGTDDCTPLDKALSECDYLTLTLGTTKEERASVYYTGAVKMARLYRAYGKHSLLSLS